MNSGWVKEICAKGVWLKDKKREGGGWPKNLGE